VTTRDRVPSIGQPSHLGFRLTAMLFAILLAAQCGWLLAAELVRPGVDRLPIDAVSADAAAEQRDAATLAAVIGAFRGDLWAQSAYTYASLLWGEPAAGANANPSGALPRGWISIDRALRNAPHESGVWLLLAGLALRHPSEGIDATAALKMSYYTGPSELNLVPLRLRFALGPDQFKDIEMRQFVGRDIRLLLARNQKTAIATAYGAASPDVRRFIEQTVKDLDPSGLDGIRASAPRPAVPRGTIND